MRALIDDRGRQVKIGRAVHPGRSARPDQPAAAGRLVPGRGRRGQGAADRDVPRDPREGARARRQGRPAHARVAASEQIAEGGVKELPLIVKADVQGSAEVLADTLTKLSDEKVKIRIIRSGVGAINESDVLLASASNAIIIGFNVRPDRNAQDMAEREQVDIRLHSVIYNVTEEIQKAHGRHARPDVQGSAARHAPKCARSSRCRRSAPSPAAWSPTAASRAPASRRRACCATTSSCTKARFRSLRRFKDDVSEVKTGFECGIGLANYNDIKVGDVIEVFTMERVAHPGVKWPPIVLTASATRSARS